jgi:hypothetical protein
MEAIADCAASPEPTHSTTPRLRTRSVDDSICSGLVWMHWNLTDELPQFNTRIFMARRCLAAV